MSGTGGEHDVVPEKSMGRRACAKAAKNAAEALVRRLLLENVALRARPHQRGKFRDAAILDSHHLHKDNCAFLQRDVHFGPDSSIMLSKCGLLEADVLQQHLVLHAWRHWLTGNLVIVACDGSTGRDFSQYSFQ